MSDTYKHKKAWQQRQDGNHMLNPDDEFDGRRYGNKRKAVAILKRKDRRRTNRKARQELQDYDTPLKRKYTLDP